MAPPICFNADIVSTVNRPASPPGARCSMFKFSGFVISIPVKLFELLSISFFVEIMSIYFGMRYFLPLDFPLPARICFPLTERITSS